MPMGHIEYVKPMLEKSKTVDRAKINEYNRQYYYQRQRAILDQRKEQYLQRKQKLIPEIIVDFTKK